MHSRGGIACIHASLLKWTMKVNNFVLVLCFDFNTKAVSREWKVCGKIICRIRMIIIGDYVRGNLYLECMHP